MEKILISREGSKRVAVLGRQKTWRVGVFCTVGRHNHRSYWCPTRGVLRFSLMFQWCQVMIKHCHERIFWKSKLLICLADFYFFWLFICWFLMCVGLHENSCALFSTHTVIVDSLSTNCQKRKSLAPWIVIPEIISVWTAVWIWLLLSNSIWWQ